MTPLKPDQKDALTKAFSGFLEGVSGETEMETEDSEDSEDMPMKKKKGKGMEKYMEEM